MVTMTTKAIATPAANVRLRLLATRSLMINYNEDFAVGVDVGTAAK